MLVAISRCCNQTCARLGKLCRFNKASFVEVRGRPWLVEAVDDREPVLTTLRLSCIADDAQGEQIEVIWDAEIGARIIQDDTWAQVGRGAPDSPEVLAAYLRDVGLGKTVEAGLVVRELLLRRRIDLIVISPPPAIACAMEGRAREQVRSHLRHH
jgi:hypothetical protein